MLGPIFRKIKCLGIGRLVKRALFEKFFFLNMSETYQNNFRLREIQPPSVLLDCPSTLLSSKGALLLCYTI